MNCSQCSYDLIDALENTMQCIEDANQRGQCGKELIKDSVDKVKNIESSFKDIMASITEANRQLPVGVENIMNSLQGGPFIFCYPGGRPN